MMSDQELSDIDTWRYGNRVATRSDAIRRLARVGLALDDTIKPLRDLVLKALFEGNRLQRTFVDDGDTVPKSSSVDGLSAVFSDDELSIAYDDLVDRVMDNQSNLNALFIDFRALLMRVEAIVPGEVDIESAMAAAAQRVQEHEAARTRFRSILPSETTNRLAYERRVDRALHALKLATPEPLASDEEIIQALYDHLYDHPLARLLETQDLLRQGYIAGALDRAGLNNPLPTADDWTGILRTLNEALRRAAVYQIEQQK